MSLQQDSHELDSLIEAEGFTSEPDYDKGVPLVFVNHRLKSLLGQILTLIDATVPDARQCKGMKDVAKMFFRAELESARAEAYGWNRYLTPEMVKDEFKGVAYPEGLVRKTSSITPSNIPSIPLNSNIPDAPLKDCISGPDKVRETQWDGKELR